MIGAYHAVIRAHCLCYYPRYIEFVGDRLLTSLGLAKKFLTKNPFPFMDQISMEGKSNMFERRIGEYQKSGVMASTKSGASAYVFTTDAEF